MKRNTRQLFLLLALWMLSCTALSAANSVYRWYTDANELREAVRATGGRPVLAFFGKANCSICDNVWTNRNFLEPESEDFLSYMEENQILGFKSRNESVFGYAKDYFKKLDGFEKEDSIFGGGEKNYTSPFLAFVRIDPETTKTGNLSPSKEILNVFDTTSPQSAKITRSNVKSWLTKLQKTTEFLKVYSPDQVPDTGDDGDDSGETGGETGGEDSTVDEMPYHWYTDMDKLRDAIKVYDRPVLIFLGKVRCSICDNVWNTSGYLEPNSKAFLSYLEENKIFGFMTRNESIFGNTRDYFKSLDGLEKEDSIFGGGEKNYTSPFLAFVRLDPKTERTGNLSPSKEILTVFDTTSPQSSKITRSNILAWLTKLMGTEEFQEAFATAEPEGEVLEFWETASDLGVSNGCYDTGKGDASHETSFTAGTTELKFTFSAQTGRRYVFSVKGSSATGAPSLADLVSASEKLSATIYPLGESSNPMLTESGDGFGVLDEGLFFVPEKAGSYVLCLKLDQAPSSDLPFALRYHYSSYTGKAGSADTPFWTWDEANVGKWTMDYDGVVNTDQKRAFFLYVGGVAWCPHCVAVDRLLFDNAAFQKAVKDYPLVMLDNRRRGEATGPSLLYSPEYQSYLQSELKQTRSISSDLKDTIAKKLSRNLEIQKSLCLNGAERIGYPTLLFCETDGKKGVRVVDRVIPLSIPKGTDLSKFSQELVESMTALLDDKSEEKDNLAATTDAALPLGTEGFEDSASKIGGLDGVDWRILESSVSANWSICVKPAESGTGYEGDAALSLELYGEDGATLKQSATGSWSEAPELLFNVVEGQKLKLKISVDSVQGTVVPYVLVGETSLPPYEIAFEKAEYPITGKQDGTGTVTLTWKKLVTNATQTGKARLVLPEGVSCSSGNEITFSGAEKGTLSLTLKGLQPNKAASAASVDSALSLEALENCRVATPGEATVKYYTLPVLEGADSENKLSLSMSENAAGFISLDILSGYAADKLSVEVTNNPEWLTVAIQDGKLVFSGTPTSSSNVELTVTLKASDTTGAYQTGGSYTVALQVKPLSDLNPAAGKNTSFTGRVYNGDKDSAYDRTLGVIKIKRNTENHQLEVSVQGEVSYNATLPDWSLEATTNNVTVGKKGDPIVLAMTTAGVGTGNLTLESVEYGILFAPDVTETSTNDYQGCYHVAMSFLESNSNDNAASAYQGFGFLKFTVNEKGSVSLTGEMPNGAKLENAATLQLCKATEATDAALDFHLTFNDDSVLSGELTINQKGDSEEADTRISGCNGVKWHQKDSSECYASQPCGVTFDSSAGILEQLKGSDNYSSLDLYAFGKPDKGLEGLTLPKGVVGELLPLGVTLEKEAKTADSASETADNGVVFQAKEREGYDLVPGLGLNVEITADGILQGGFQLFQKDGTPSKAEFRGIFTPVPASCCGSDPDAIAYGRIVIGEESWPVMIIPNRPANLTDLHALELQTTADGKVGWSGKQDGELGVLMGVTSTEKKLLGYSTESAYACALPANGSKLYAATAQYGYLPEGNASNTATYLELKASLESGDSSETAGDSAEGQWLLLALPRNFRSAGGFPEGTILYTLDDKQAFHRLDASKDVDSDEVFFLHLMPGKEVTLKGLQFSEDEASDANETAAASRVFQLVPEDDERLEGDGVECWHWESPENAFRPEAPAESIGGIEGFRQGVWLKAQKASSTAQ